MDLYERESIIATSAVENNNLMPVMDELDAPPSMEERCKAIDSLACNKEPGNEGISPEVIKAGKKTVLLHHLHELLLQCWEEGAVPQGMHDSTIITLYKNKGGCSDYNYRGISLLSIVRKAFARAVLNRLQSLAECVYPEAQCGSRAGRSTVDVIFSLKQLQEKCHDQAFDLVSRRGLFTLLQSIGCPP